MSCPQVYSGRPARDLQLNNLSVSDKLTAKDLVACRLNGTSVRNLIGDVKTLASDVTNIMQQIDSINDILNTIPCPVATYTVGVNCPYTTISAAIAQAVADGSTRLNPQLIYVRPGLYEENLTLSDGIFVAGLSEGRSSCTKVVGTHKITANSLSACINLHMVGVGTNPIVQLNDQSLFAALHSNLTGFNIAKGPGIGATIIATLFENCDIRGDGSDAAVLFNYSGDGNCVNIVRWSVIDMMTFNANLFSSPPLTSLLFVNFDSTTIENGQVALNGTVAGLLRNSNFSAFNNWTVQGNTAFPLLIEFDNCLFNGNFVISDLVRCRFQNCVLNSQVSIDGNFAIDNPSVVFYNTTLANSVEMKGSPQVDFRNAQVGAQMLIQDGSLVNLTDVFIGTQLLISGTAQVSGSSLFVVGFVNIGDTAQVKLTNSWFGLNVTVIGGSVELNQCSTPGDFTCNGSSTLLVRQSHSGTFFQAQDTSTMTIDNCSSLDGLLLSTSSPCLVSNSRLQGQFVLANTLVSLINCAFIVPVGTMTFSGTTVASLDQCTCLADISVDDSANVAFCNCSVKSVNTLNVTGTGALDLINSKVDTSAAAGMHTVNIGVGVTSARFSGNTFIANPPLVPDAYVVNGIGAAAISGKTNTGLNPGTVANVFDVAPTQFVPE